MSEVLHAGSFIAGNALDLDLLVPAAEAAIVELDLQTLRFRHPLIRSAVRQSASAPQRRRVHEALAETLEAEPDRRVWHRAALITEAHEDVTLELEEAGRRALRRGALHVAITALRRQPSSVTLRTKDADSSRRASPPSSSVSPNSQRRCCARSMSRTGQSSARSRPGSRR